MEPFDIKASTARVEYILHIRSRVTIIMGESGTGKTTLVSVIGRYISEKGARGRKTAQVQCRLECGVLGDDDTLEKYQDKENTIVFIDEKHTRLYTREFANQVNRSKCHVVIMTRKSLGGIAYGFNDIYQFRNSGKFHENIPLYQINTEKIHPNLIVTEDSGTGYDFWKEISKNIGADCISSGGRSKMPGTIASKAQEYKCVLAVADCCGTGDISGGLVNVQKKFTNVHICLPESFEYMLMDSVLFGETFKNREEEAYRISVDKRINMEKAYAELLRQYTKGTGAEYKKRGRLKKCYTEQCCYTNATDCRYMCGFKKCIKLRSILKSVEYQLDIDWRAFEERCETNKNNQETITRAALADSMLQGIKEYDVNKDNNIIGGINEK